MVMSVLDRTILALLERDDSMRTGLTFMAIKRRLQKVNVNRTDSTINSRLRALCTNGSIMRIEREVRGGTKSPGDCRLSLNTPKETSMPCNSDYLDPTAREAELQRTAKLAVYVLREQKAAIPQWVLDESKNQYASNGDIVPLLCELVNRMTKRQRERIVYNAHDETSRDLADWWDTHQAADREREAAEAEVARVAALRQSAAAKLTPEELDAVTRS